MRKSEIAGAAIITCLVLVGIIYWIWDDGSAAKPADQTQDTGGQVVVAPPPAEGTDAAAFNPGEARPDVRPPGGGGRRGDGGGPGFGPGGGPGFPPGGGRGGMPLQARDSFAEAVTVLGETTLNPDVVLTPEQKEKIQAIRHQYKAARENGQAGGAAGAPMADAAAQKLMAVLTAEQIVAMDAQAAKRRAAEAEIRRLGGDVFGGGPGGRGSPRGSRGGGAPQ